MMTMVAVILFMILCPCASYLLVKRHLIPWSGGVFLVLEDDSLISVDKWDCDAMKLPADAVIKGVFLAGARINMMPDVSFRMLQVKEGQSPLGAYYYRHFETDNGVYQIYMEPISRDHFYDLILDVMAPYPWSAGKRNEGKEKYWYRFSEMRFSGPPRGEGKSAVR